MPSRPSTDLAVYIRLVLAQKFAIAGFAFLVMVAAAITVLLMGERYDSHAMLLVQNPEFLEESTVTSEPLSVKTIANLAEDISLIGEILERYKADYDLLALLARSVEPRWEGDEDALPVVSAALAELQSATDVRRLAGERPVSADQAQRIAGYEPDMIQGILEADREALEETDPIYFQEQFKVGLSIDTQTAYSIIYQPVVQLTASMGTAKSARSLAIMWRDMLLHRLQETLGKFTSDTAQDLRDKRDEAKERWLSAMELVSDYQRDNNVVVLQSELEGLQGAIDRELLPNYYAALAEAATAARTFEVLEKEVDRRLGDGGWLGSTIQDSTHVRDLLAHLDAVEDTTLAELESQQQALRRLAQADAGGLIVAASPELDDKIEELRTDLRVRREIIRGWLALNRAREARIEFLEESEIESKRRRLSELVQFIANDRLRAETATVDISAASAALASIRAELDEFRESDMDVDQETRGAVFLELQQQRAAQVQKLSSAQAVLERLNRSITEKTQELKALQEEVNRLERQSQEIEQRLLVAQTSYENLQEDYLDLRTQYRVARSKSKILSGAANALERMLREHQEDYRRLHEMVKKHMDAVQTLTGVAESEHESYLAVSDKYSEAELVLNEEFEPVRAWGDPREPIYRTSPRRTMTVLAAGVLAVILGMVFVVFRELIEPTRIA